MISTVLLNWNRIHLLKKTVQSYLSTISVPYELIIVDNNSSDGSKEYIQNICKNNSNHHAILLTEHLGGGESINLGLEQAKFPYLHISENDYEYLPGWDKELLSKFDTFEKLGQLSILGADSEMPPVEIRGKFPSTPVTKNSKTILLTDVNVVTTSIIRREIWDKGLRWISINEPNTPFQFPNDHHFSTMVRQMGYWVAWNDKYVVINHGHNVAEWQQHPDYYLENYRSKPWLRENGWIKRLNENGYDLLNENGIYKIIKKDNIET